MSVANGRKGRRKATHQGHCQACGRLQKLPHGGLSTHGYTVAHGFFSGICKGSEYQPFEVSCDEVKGYIQAAQVSLDFLEGKRAGLRHPVIYPKAMVRHYTPGGWNTRTGRRVAGGYTWIEVGLEEQVSEGGYRTFWYTQPGPDGQPKLHKLEAYGFRGSLLDLATKLNTTYADWLGAEADSLARYITWQQARVDAWAPAPLLPLDTKDKQGFQPTPEAY